MSELWNTILMTGAWGKDIEQRAEWDVCSLTAFPPTKF